MACAKALWPSDCHASPDGAGGLSTASSEVQTITRVSSIRGQWRASSCASRLAGRLNGVMRSTIGNWASANTAAARANLSASGSTPVATALTQRARLALPGEKRTSQPSSQRCCGGALAFRPASSMRASSSGSKPAPSERSTAVTTGQGSELWLTARAAAGAPLGGGAAGASGGVHFTPAS